MSKISFAVATGLLAMGCGGCANLNMLGRSTNLPGDGIAVHLDAPQRVVISKLGKTCAEPSPDALQAYASSLGLGFAAPTKESVSIAQQLQAGSGSFGLRSQSITLMRDALYRICELYYSGAIKEEDAVQLMQRSQDLTLGVLAIEQLTGAVVAHQVMLNTSGTATAAAAINDTQKEVDRARADEETKKIAAEEAAKALETQKKTAAEKAAAAVAAKAAAAGPIAAAEKLAPALDEATKAAVSARTAASEANGAVAGVAATVATVTKNEKPLREKAEKATQEVTRLTTELEQATQAKDQPRIDTLTQELAKAREAETAAKALLKPVADQLVVEKKRLEDATKKAQVAATALGKAEEKLAEVSAAMTQIQSDPLFQAHVKAAEAAKSASDDLAKKQAASESTRKAYEEAQATTRKVEAIGRTATANAAANGATTGQFSTSASRSNIDKDTAEVIAGATENIVTAVLYKGHLTDMCATLLLRYADNPAALIAVAPYCSKVIEAAIRVYERESQRSTPGKNKPPLAANPQEKK